MSGIFKTSRFPEGKYAAFLLPLYKEDEPTQGIDSTSVFSLIEGLDTESDYLDRGGIFDMVELPDHPKPK